MSREGERRRLWEALRLSALEHLPLGVVLFVYVSGFYLVREWFQLPGISPPLRAALFRASEASFAGLVVVMAVHVLHFPARWLTARWWPEKVNNPASSDGEGWIAYRRQQVDAFRVVGLALASFAVTYLFAAFPLYKAAIPRINPFSWDPLFVELDRRLHLGHHPWELLQPPVRNG